MSTPHIPAQSPAQLWVMTVGIRQYQNRSPLRYAERDAKSLHDWLTQEAEVSPDHALLLTDESPSFYQHSTYPDRSTLSYWIGQLRTQGVQPGDTLWFFFSGIGDRWNGDDYLLPIDADPTAPPSTWIKTKSLLSALKSLPTDRIVVCLDINRSRSVHPGQPLGQQTAHIAQQLGINTILSCQPDEVSQESPDFGQGLFTAALIDTFRSHPSHQGLPEFFQRLTSHLPSLCRQCDRPPQTPLLILTNPSAIAIPTPKLSDCLTTGDLRRYVRPPLMMAIPAAPVTADRPTAIVLTPPQTPPPTKRHTIPLELKLVGLTGLVSLLFLGALTVLGLRSISASQSANQLAPSLSPVPSPSRPPRPSITPLQVPEQPAGDSAAILEEARNFITPTNAEELIRAIDRASQIPPGDPGYPSAQRQIDRWSEQLFRLSQLEANQGRWREAIAIASQVRRDRISVHRKAQSSIQIWKQRSR